MPLSTVRQSEVSEVPPLLRSRSLMFVNHSVSQRAVAAVATVTGNFSLSPSLPSKYCHTKAKQDPTTQLDGQASSCKLMARMPSWLCNAKFEALNEVDSACRHNVSLRTSSFGIRTMDKYFGGGEADEEDLLVSAIRFTRLQWFSLS